MKWYVLQFTATRYMSVFTHLERLNFSYFCPMKTERYRRPDKILSFREKSYPAFPGYLFIQADFEEIHSTKITSIPYIQRFISFGGEPLPVPEEVMQELLSRDWLSPNSKNVSKKSIPHRLAEILLMENAQQRSTAFINYITENSLTHKMKRKTNERYQTKNSKRAQTSA
ncbi:transcription termination factor NusG [Salmonella enterica subsp. enterica serovar Sandiego]|nr:transcription termination factor NusG [Salmonella enterica subsp. enterica serovar Sandiego]EIT4523661.1 transcription termination factor NusG [Salmonella enterica subsp. enterica serovar Sandiego]